MGRKWIVKVETAGFHLNCHFHESSYYSGSSIHGTQDALDLFIPLMAEEKELLNFWHKSGRILIQPSRLMCFIVNYNNITSGEPWYDKKNKIASTSIPNDAILLWVCRETNWMKLFWKSFIWIILKNNCYIIIKYMLNVTGSALLKIDKLDRI